MFEWPTRAILPSLRREKNIAYFSAEEPAFDLVGYFNANGVALTHVAIYRSKPGLTKPDGELYSPNELHSLCANMEGVICFASPKSVQGFLDATDAYRTLTKGPLIAAAIGPTTKKTLLDHFEHVVESPVNSLAALFDLAAKTVRSHEPGR